mmetsp:Transcript_31335/g.87874  ORF Transcript_31335/g.87874 Transcript_31335/m.87874 type:complete len:219 (-) Transcript_31335:93-749(-)
MRHQGHLVCPHLVDHPAGFDDGLCPHQHQVHLPHHTGHARVEDDPHVVDAALLQRLSALHAGRARRGLGDHDVEALPLGRGLQDHGQHHPREPVDEHRLAVVDEPAPQLRDGGAGLGGDLREAVPAVDEVRLDALQVVGVQGRSAGHVAHEELAGSAESDGRLVELLQLPAGVQQVLLQAHHRLRLAPLDDQGEGTDRGHRHRNLRAVRQLIHKVLHY